jgi:putative heme-binding domain-containing protein
MATMSSDKTFDLNVSPRPSVSHDTLPGRMNSRMACVSISLAIAAMIAPFPASGAQSSNEIQQGKAVYDRLCVVCHATDGTGGEAPALNHPNLDRAPDDDALRSLVNKGVPNRMPAINHLTDAELNQLVAYVRALGRSPSLPLDGVAQTGARIYQRAGCPSCHIVNGQGGTFGPVLSNIGALRGASYLRRALVEPGAALPVGTLTVPGKGLLEYLPVRVVTNDGRDIHGIRVNEDSITIQIRDGGNQIHSFRKSDLRQIDKQIGTSLMPSVADRLTAAELTDLVAYLSSLREGK